MSAVLEISNLAKAYGEVLALDDLSLTLAAGEVVALLGPNGSGKTTTIRCAAGLLQPSAGRIAVNGFDLQRNYREARRQFAYLPQQAHFPASLTVAEAAAFHCALRGMPRSASLDALAEVGLAGAVQQRLVGQLSGGMRQRLSLAVASLGDAPLVLLDEPTANLDPEAALEFREQARRWRSAGRALLLSTHVLTDVETLADRVVVLVAGKVVAVETNVELKQRLGRYSRLRVEVGEAREQHRQAALDSGALEARLNCSAITITAPPEKRVAIIDSLSRVGRVGYFETEKPSIEDIYIEYVHGGAGRAAEALR